MRLEHEEAFLSREFYIYIYIHIFIDDIAEASTSV